MTCAVVPRPLHPFFDADQQPNQHLKQITGAPNPSVLTMNLPTGRSRRAQYFYPIPKAKICAPLIRPGSVLDGVGSLTACTVLPGVNGTTT